MVNKDQKVKNEDTEFVKDEQDSTQKYIFQKSMITKVAVIVIIAFLVLIVLGLTISGVSFFESGF